jgi:phosphatidate cytidylyltransferase
MHAIFYYIVVYLILGAVGMHLGNKKQSRQVQRQRWLKYATYLIITAAVITCIFTSTFIYCAIVIAAVGLFEVVGANFRGVVNIKQATFSIFVYSAVAFGFIGFAQSFNNTFLLFIYFQVFVFDAFCQVTGQLAGRHKLAPTISPTKTVEGLAGGWTFCILTAVVARSWVHQSLFMALLSGTLTGLTSFIGDIAGSYFKRLVKVKDYSNLLPGQGGFIDRFGSLMVTGAVYFLCRKYLE